MYHFGHFKSARVIQGINVNNTSNFCYLSNGYKSTYWLILLKLMGIFSGIEGLET